MFSRIFSLLSILLIFIFTASLPAQLGTSTHSSVHAQSGRQPEKKKQQQGDGEVIEEKGPTIKVETSLINLDVVVHDKKTGGIYQGLKPGNFIIYEDGVKQEITNFAASEAPITLVMILEYSRQISFIRGEIINPAGQFVTQFVRPKDQVAIIAYDIRPAVLNDFTDNPSQLAASVGLLLRNVPTFSESNLFDAITFVIQGGKLDKEEYGGLLEVEGRTAILLISLGIDTFSKTTFDKTFKLVENAGIPIYTIGVGNLFYKLNEDRLSSEARLNFLQSANQLRAFSERSGGRFFPVTFEGEIPSTLKAISALLRNQYSLGYVPTNTRREGKKRKVEIEVDVNGDGKSDNKTLVVQYRKTYQEPKN
ncbi:MAG: VWA domain-containing protein [Acidobacteriota bacterium]